MDEHQFIEAIKKIPCIDSCSEVTESGIKITLLFDGGKLLMVSKLRNDFPGFNDMLIFSFFINRKLIASNYMEVESFVTKFNDYRRSGCLREFI